MMDYLPRPENLPPGFDLPQPISGTFIPATVFDNPALLRANPEYYIWLESLPLLERERLLCGNWKIRPAAGLYFKREWCTIVDEVPADLDIVRYWDLAATEKTEFNDPDWTVGIKLGRNRNGGYWPLTWYTGGRTPAMSKKCCSTSLHRTANESGSGLARIRGKRAKAKPNIWYARLATSLW
jgi:hypothetical protein